VHYVESGVKPVKPKKIERDQVGDIGRSQVNNQDAAKLLG
jgi:hypothetical protein